MATLKHFIALLLVLFCHQWAIAANGDWLNLTNSSHITTIKQDGNVLWVASRGGGLAKIDLTTGNKTFYNKANSGLPSNNVEAVAIEGNNIWIGTYDQGLVRFDGQQWEVFNTSNSNLDFNEIYDVQTDTDGNVWIGTRFALVKFDGTDFYDYTIPGYTAAYSLAIYSPEDIYMSWNVGSSFNTELYHFNGDSVTNVNEVMLQGIYRLYKDSQDRLWVCHEHGVAYKSGNQWTLFDSTNSIIPNAQTRAMTEWNSKVYVASDMGIFTYDGNTWGTTDIAVENASYLWPVNGQLYIGTLQHGLYKNNGSQTQPVHASNSNVPANNFFNIERDFNDRMVLSASIGNGIVYFDNNQWTSRPTTYRWGFYNHMAVAPDNSLWLISYDSLYHISATGSDAWNLDSAGIPGSGFSCMAVDGSGKVYVGTYSYGFFTFDGADFELYNRSNSNISSNEITSFAFMGNEVWIGTNVDQVQQIQYGGGIEVFDGTSFNRLHPGNSGLQSKYISHLITYGDSLWIGGDGGFSVYHNGTFTNYLHNNGSGCPLVFISHMAVNNQGEVFASGYNTNSTGIMVKWDGTSFESFGANNSPIADFSYGIQDMLFDKHDNLWLLTPQGIFIYKEGGVTDIEEVLPSAIKPVVDVDGIKVYPNPAKNLVTVETQTGGTVTFFNLAGETIARLSPETNTTVDVSGWVPGIYLYHVATAQGVEIGKLVVE